MKACPLFGGSPLFGVFIKREFTVYNCIVLQNSLVYPQLNSLANFQSSLVPSTTDYMYRKASQHMVVDCPSILAELWGQAIRYIYRIWLSHPPHTYFILTSVFLPTYIHTGPTESNTESNRQLPGKPISSDNPHLRFDSRYLREMTKGMIIPHEQIVLLQSIGQGTLFSFPLWNLMLM